MEAAAAYTLLLLRTAIHLLSVRYTTLKYITVKDIEIITILYKIKTFNSSINTIFLTKHFIYLLPKINVFVFHLLLHSFQLLMTAVLSAGGAAVRCGHVALT